LQKVIFIVLIGFFMISCSVSKNRAGKSIVIDETKRHEIGYNEVKRGNLTGNAFIIQRAEIEITDKNQNQKFFAVIRYAPPDTFLISVRTIAGIEAARIFVTDDTILINDRMNRILFYGTQDAGRKKYGFSSRIFPVLFGDIIVRDNAETHSYNCIDGMADIESFADGYKLNYTISCTRVKTISLAVTGNYESRPVIIKYFDFEKIKNFIYPGKVSISHIANLGQVDIRFSKVEIPWIGDIVFIPGNNYEHIEIK